MDLIEENLNSDPDLYSGFLEDEFPEDPDYDPDSREYIELHSEVDGNKDNIVGKKEDILQTYPGLKSEHYTVIPSKNLNSNVISYLIDNRPKVV